MSISYNTSIPKNGIIVNYDFSNPKCYSGSGSTVYNTAISGSYNGTLENSPTYSNGTISFNGSNQSLSWNIPCGQERTVCILYKQSNTGSGWGPIWRMEDWKERVFPTTITLINYAGTYYSLNLSTVDNVWQHLIYSYDGNTCRSYKNGVKLSEVGISNSWNTGNYTFYSGKQAGGSTTAYVAMDLKHVSFYDRVLSDDESFQHFSALRGRVNL